MKHIIKNTLPLLALTLVFTSCLKDHLAMDPAQSNNVIEFANTGANVSPATAIYPRFASDMGSLGTGDSATFNVNLSYSGAEMAPNDITVTLALDTAALRAYNDDLGTDYVAPPESVYKLATTAVIKKGTQVLQLKVAIINNDNFDFNVNYALPLKIAAVSSGVISGNYGLAIYSFAVRNVFDGVYEMTGTLTDNASSAITGNYPVETQLITYSGNSIALWDPVYAKAYGHIIRSGTGNSYYGYFSPVFAFDASGNVTVSNYFGDLAGPSKRSAALNPTGINKITYGADGHVEYFEVSYFMTQSGTTRTSFNEKFTYKRPR
ncbi:protein of unknown function [Chitinophaga sp. CF118]|uniref:DUF1735 domain-containing protein n=1 Tax=Chitinophaga sp. CF118 TaxID=1884367 RepID=UPI0008EF8B59|nr:DUF1735 domain-containing protein [Chitinophaga sp. CF118]SFD78011.1 protein of unknown function [Chitinophaga sp. CF118]